MSDIEIKPDDVQVETSILRLELERFKAELKSCANELCYKCGAYRNEHLGACDHCRWLNARKGKFE